MLSEELTQQLIGGKELAEQLTNGSNKRVEWRCKHGHIWEATVYARATLGQGCPYCSGKKVWPGFNDLATTHPTIAAQLKNQSISDKISAGSHKKVTWICKRGHEYEATVVAKVKSTNPDNCPYCSNKRVLIGFNDLATTHPSIASQLVDQNLGTKLTAGSHKKVEWRCPRHPEHIWMTTPHHRTRTCGNDSPTDCPYCSGKKVMAGFNDLATTRPDLAKWLVDASLATCLTKSSNRIVKWRCEQGHTFERKVSEMNMREAPFCPECSERLLHKGRNDLATTHPKLAAELVDAKKATAIKAGSNSKELWRCPTCKNTYETSPLQRTSKGSGCPYCAGKAVREGFNDLTTTHPSLIAELARPEEAKSVTAGSHAMLLWRCDQGHAWKAAVYNRTLGATSCPWCAGNGTSKPEKELAKAIAKLAPDLTVLRRDRSLLKNRELDIVIPELHLAIEFNGVFWHSEDAGKTKRYHADKLRAANAAGYSLVQIWQDVWENRRDQALRLLAARLGATENLHLVLDDFDPRMEQTIYARSLTPCVVGANEAKPFMKQNHIQGFSAAGFHMALRDADGAIRALMSVRSPRHNARMHRADGEWEVQRYATLGHVPGGFSKLLAHAERELARRGENLTRWISFSDNDVSDGRMYASCGFSLDKILAPDYTYVALADQTHRRQPKQNYQRKRFRDDPALVWDESWTETEAAKRNKLVRCWDSGKKRWIRPARTL